MKKTPQTRRQAAAMGFAHSKAIERRYAAQLAKVAKEVGKLAARFADDVPGLVRAQKEYAAKLDP